MTTCSGPELICRLAERSRPISLDTYIGQDDLVGPGSLLRARIEAGEGVGSCILWGPPGCGKTTMARLIARTANAEFKELSATRCVECCSLCVASGGNRFKGREEGMSRGVKMEVGY